MTPRRHLFWTAFRAKHWCLMLLCISATPLPSAAQAQDNINFQDLARPGPPVIKRYTVTGLEADGRSYLAKFDGVDTERIEARRAMMSSGSGQSSSSSSSSYGGTKTESPKAKTFVCTIYCQSSSGPTINREVKAASRREAAQFMGANADQICRGTGFDRASARAFPENQCRER